MLWGTSDQGMPENIPTSTRPASKVEDQDSVIAKMHNEQTLPKYDATIVVMFVKTHSDAMLPMRNHGNRPLTESEKENYIKAREQILASRRIYNPNATVGSDPDNVKVSGTADSGYDIFACEDAVIPAQGRGNVVTGIQVGFITPGFWFRVESRSGLSFKHGIICHPGIIDNQYRGPLGIWLYNHSDKDYKVSKGDRIAQIVMYQIVDFNTSWVEQVEETARGDKGMGSSGK